ncbi:hypothetical protein MSAN_00479800 [Mycena sanguinolenta]|uniref:Uncharacterized protein n=1 Tax=Mycena sanguinolenta TaxID=230812 RepID=A0A8H7DER2_9AGAR|nr:hypothetical protein MSAN_00479800 [Mycena sanguinolenta]
MPHLSRSLYVPHLAHSIYSFINTHLPFQLTQIHVPRTSVSSGSFRLLVAIPPPRFSTSVSSTQIRPQTLRVSKFSLNYIPPSKTEPSNLNERSQPQNPSGAKFPS